MSLTLKLELWFRNGRLCFKLTLVVRIGTWKLELSISR